MHNDETVISDVPDMINKAPIIPGHSPSPAVAGMSGSEHNNTTITTTTVTTDTVTTTTPTTTESVPRPGPVGHGTEYGVQVAGRVTGSASGSGIHEDQIGNAPVTGISSDQAGASGISSSSSPSQQQHQQKKQQENEHGLNTTIIASNSLKTSTSTEEQEDTLKSSSVPNTGTDKTPDEQQDIIPLRAKPAPHQPDHSVDHPIDHPGHYLKDPGDPSDDHPVQASESNRNHHPSCCPRAQPGSRPPASPSTYIRSSPLTSELPNGPDGGDHDSTTPFNPQPPSTMIFADLYKSPRSPLNKLRHSFPHHQPVVLPSDLDADLVSKDKAKQKEAVRKYLLEKIRNDWDFEWAPVTQPRPTEAAATFDEKQPHEKSDIAQLPPDSTIAPNEHGSPRIADGAVAQTFDDDAPRDPGEEADSESDVESVYSTISEDLVHYRPRAEWTSDLSDNDEPPAPNTSSPFRFDSPDAVGTAVKSSLEAKRAKRRRAVRKEASWNPGLACFEARRDAWTGAKTFRVKPKPMCPASPTTAMSTTTRRLSFWRHHRSSESTSAAAVAHPASSPPAAAAAATNLSAPLSPTTTRNSQQSAQSDAVSDTSARGAGAATDNSTVPSTSPTSPSKPDTYPAYPVQTLLPLPPPLLPPQNPMRASVTPSIYPSLYDKIIVNNMQPSCPVNLADVLRACVVGWKRDGEWPPRSQYTNVAVPPMLVPKPMSAAEIAAQRQRKVALQKQMQQQKEAREKAAREASEVRERAREAARLQREEREQKAREAREQKEEREKQERMERAAEKQRRKSDATAQGGAPGAGRRSSIVALVGGVVNHLTRVPTAEDRDRERSGSQSDENLGGGGGGGGGGKGGIRRSLQKVFSLGHGGGQGHQANGNPLA
ncbi:uncharacterized protein B0T23DRAFT_413565 [Neurospora hispaniola]|uniref:Gag1-like clamp domain-containing protein n=1 Tax=Neurospora hispaniola TaxID=588809 RepID=A0AAJ0I642_9PEZI|nr:hypothetical protein B0T23DRAFT_413565 [Neurospora hispaniola]